MIRLKNILIKFFIIFTLICFVWHDVSHAAPKNYFIYTVKKNDTLFKILKKFKLTPVFGKKGSLNKTLALNPKKKKTKGNLIYPREKIKIPYFKGRKKRKGKFATGYYQQKPLEKEVAKKEISINLIGQLEKNLVTLKWEVVNETNELKYEVHRALSPGTEFKIIEENLKVKEFKEKNLDYNKDYFYKIIGKDENGILVQSNEIKIKYEPSFYMSLKGLLHDKKILLEWDTLEDNNDIKYTVKRKLKEEKNYKDILINSNETKLIDDKIDDDEIYNYQVSASLKNEIIATTNEIEVISFKSEKIPQNISLNIGTSYFTYHEYNTQNNTDSILYSSVSPSLGIKYTKNWTQNFNTYGSAYLTYVDFLNSGYYRLSGNPFVLYGLNLGVNYNIIKNLYIHDKISFGNDVIYKPFSNNSSLQNIYVLNNSVYLGLNLYNGDKFVLQSEIGYISSISLTNSNGIGFGYEYDIILLKKFDSFNLATKVYYLNKNIKTSDVTSNVADFGVVGEITFAVGDK